MNFFNNNILLKFVYSAVFKHFHYFFIVKFNNLLKLLNIFLFCNIFYLFFDICEYIFLINIFFFKFFCLIILFYLLIFCKDFSIFKNLVFSLLNLYYLFFFFRIIFFSKIYFNPLFYFFSSFLFSIKIKNFSFFSLNFNIFIEFFLYIFLISFIYLYIRLTKLWSYDYILSCFFMYIGCCLLLQSSHYLTFFLSLEIISFSTYILIGFNAGNLYSSESSLKYFILSAISSSLFLIGLILIYYSYGSLFFWSYEYLNNTLVDFELNIFKYIFYINKMYLGHVLILLVLFFKLGLAPFHFWVADVYEGSSIISMGLLMFVAKTAYFFGLIKFYNLFIFYNKDFYSSLLITFSVLSIILGVFSALRQKKLKRFLAFTSVVNMGYILCLLSFNFYSSFFYFYLYMLISFSFFLLLIYYVNVIQSLIYLTDLNKVNTNKQIFVIFLFFFAAVPPSPLFIFKFYLFLNLFENNYFLILFFLIISSLISLFYYIRLVQYLIYKQEIKLSQIIFLKDGTFYFQIFYLFSFLFFFLIFFWL